MYFFLGWWGGTIFFTWLWRHRTLLGFFPTTGYSISASPTFITLVTLHKQMISKFLCLISISRSLSWFPQGVEFNKKSHSASPKLNASSPPKLFVLNSTCAPGKGTNTDPCLKPETKVFFFLGSHILLTYLLLSLVQVPLAFSPKITTLLTTLPAFILIPSNPLSTVKSQYCFKITCDYVTSLFNIFQGFPSPHDRLVTP